MSSDQTLNENISALVQPRIHSSDKSVLDLYADTIDGLNDD